MGGIEDRIRIIVDFKYNKNKSAFARDLNITPAFAAQLYSGLRSPSERTISDICRVCCVDEVWLRTGAGEPFRQKTRREQIDEYIGQLSEGKRSDLEQLLIEVMAETTVEEWQALATFLRKITEKYNANGK